MLRYTTVNFPLRISAESMQQEWLNDGHFTPVIRKLNVNLIKWLEEYNITRPHQTLDYMTPCEYLEYNITKTTKVVTDVLSQDILLQKKSIEISLKHVGY